MKKPRKIPTKGGYEEEEKTDKRSYKPKENTDVGVNEDKEKAVKSSFVPPNTESQTLFSTINDVFARLKFVHANFEGAVLRRCFEYE